MRVIAGERALDPETSGMDALDRIAFGGEIFGQQLAQLGVVVDDEHAQLRRASRQCGHGVQIVIVQSRSAAPKVKICQGRLHKAEQRAPIGPCSL